MYNEKEIIRAQGDKKYRDKFIMENSRIVWLLVNQSIPFADQDRKLEAYQEGMIGFINGIMAFDKKRKGKQAYNFILRCIRNRLKKHFNIDIKSSLVMDEKILIYKHRFDDNGHVLFLTKKGKWVSKTGRSMKEFVLLDKDELWSPQELFVSTSSKTSKKSNDYSGDGKAISLGELLRYDETAVDDTVSQNSLVKRFLVYMENNLTPKKFLAVRLYLGLVDGVQWTTREAGKKAGISRTHVTNACRKAIEGFRESIGVEIKQED